MSTTGTQSELVSWAALQLFSIWHANPQSVPSDSLIPMLVQLAGDEQRAYGGQFLSTVVRGLPSDELANKLDALISASHRVPTDASNLEGFEQDGISFGARLGAGGMGTVYRGWQHSPSRPVAIKVTRHDLHGTAGDEFDTLLNLEKEKLGGLTHPHVVQVIVAGLLRIGAGKSTYVVMPFVDGPNLREEFRAPRPEFRSTVDASLRFFLGVCGGLTHIHSRGLIHGDIKPENIILAADPHGGPLPSPTIIDLGLAVFAESNGRTLGGTPPYVPRELLAGAASPSERSDVFALGIVLFELLGGRLETLPAESRESRLTSLALADAFRTDRHLESLQVGWRDVSDLALIVERATHFDASKRYASVVEVARDVQRFLEYRPISIRHQDKVYRLLLAIRRYRTALALMLLALVATAAFAVYYTVHITAANRSLAAANRTVGIELANSMVAEGNALRLAQRWRDSTRQFERGRDQYVSLSASPLPALASLADVYWTSPPPLNSWNSGGGSVNCAVLSPNGGTLLSGSNDSKVRIWDVVTGELRGAMIGHTSIVRCLALFLDGKRAVSGSWDHNLIVWDLAKQQQLAQLKGHTGMVEAVAVGGDGTVYSGSSDETAIAWDVEGKAPRWTHRCRGQVQAIALDEAHDRILVAGNGGTIEVLKRKDGSLIQSLQFHNGSISSLVVSRDGKYFLSAGLDGKVARWSLESMAVDIPGGAEGIAITAVAFGENSDVIVFAADDGVVHYWDLRNASRVLELAQVVGGSSRPCLAVNGSDSVAVVGGADGRITVWGLKYGLTERRIALEAKDMTSVRFALGDRVIVGGSWDGAVRVWATESGRLLETLRGDADVVNAIAVPPHSAVVLAGSNNGLLETFDFVKGKRLTSVKGHESRISSVAVTADGQLAITGSWDFDVKSWDVASGKVTGTMPGGRSNAIDAVDVTPTGRYALSACKDGVVRVWDRQSNSVTPISAHPSGASSIRVGGDGTEFVTGGVDNTIRMWKLPTTQPVKELQGHRGNVDAISTSATFGVAVSSGQDSTVRLWDLENGRELRTLLESGARSGCVALSDDGTRAVGAMSGGGLLLCDWGRAEAYLTTYRTLQKWGDEDRTRPLDGSRLLFLANWYIDRGYSSWAMQCIDRAEKSGGSVPSWRRALCRDAVGDHAGAAKDWAAAAAKATDGEEKWFLELQGKASKIPTGR